METPTFYINKVFIGYLKTAHMQNSNKTVVRNTLIQEDKARTYVFYLLTY